MTGLLHADATPDVLDADWDASAWWTTTNFGEAIPGVLTPLNWSWWSDHGERAARRAFWRLGAVTEAEAALPADPGERAFGIFHGRFAAKVDFLGGLGDRLPGTTAEAVAASILGELPAGFTGSPTRSRYPAVALRMPREVANLPRRLHREHDVTERWWTDRVAAAPGWDLPTARAMFGEAARRFEQVSASQVVCLFAGVQPVFDQVTALALTAGDPELAGRVLVGQGSHAELALVEDLWALSRERLTLGAFLARHGYHGPLEGEIAARVWRERPDPVLTLAARYADAPDAEAPERLAVARRAERDRARTDLLAGLPAARRPAARAALRLADRHVPLRGVAKASFLRALDVGRAAARRTGEHLAAAGALAEADDVFLLGEAELMQPVPAGGWQDVVAARQAERDRHLAVELPSSWLGRPEVQVREAPAEQRAGVVVRGLGVCPGVVEAEVAVVTDPAVDDVEPDRVLVARTTDPSWAGVMFTSAALVVDIGGQLSHAAVVARELGVPCVMGTQDGTARLRTGDRVRVDGGAGTVEVLG